jgi:hypothetical protein
LAQVTSKQIKQQEKRKEKEEISNDRRFRTRSIEETRRALRHRSGGLIAGTLDLTQAITLFGRRVPLVIAAGLLGQPALHGGTATYILGVLLHYFIACSATAVYYAASRRLAFLLEHPLVCGLFFGMAGLSW